MKKILLTIFVFTLVFPSIVNAKQMDDPYAKQWAYDDIGVYTAWDYTIGSGDVVVAIIDNGFDTFHPDLRGNVWKNKNEIANNNVDDDKNGYIDDLYGWNFVNNDNDSRPDVNGLSLSEKAGGIFNHGTLVAGLIGAVGNNKLDGVGISPKVKLMNLKVVSNGGSGSMADLPDAIRYAVDNGADVINISMVGSEDDHAEDINEAVEYAYKNNVVMVAAAGNDASSLDDTPLYPICSGYNQKENWVLGVSAMNEKHRLASFSNTGSNCIDITAPGVNVSSTVRFSPTNGLEDRYNGGWNGTSFAAPIVSGAAALIKSIQPSWGPVEIYQVLLSSVHHTPSLNEDVYADLFGAGLLQIDKAVKYVIENFGFDNGKESIVMFDYKTGNYNFLNIKDKSLMSKNAFNFQGIDDIESFSLDQENRFVTVKYLDDGSSDVSILNDEMVVLDNWQINSSGVLDLAVGDINRDNNLEFIFSPKYGSAQIYRIYTPSGELLDEYHLEKEKHKGVLLEVDNSGDIVTIYNNQVVKFEDNKPISVFEVSQLNSIGNFVIGDMDGDGVDEYMLSSALGEASTIVYYGADGKYKRKFFAYDTSYLGGVKLAIVDYDRNGKDDLIVVPLSTNEPVRVWSGQVKKIDQWYLDKHASMRLDKVLLY